MFGHGGLWVNSVAELYRQSDGRGIMPSLTMATEKPANAATPSQVNEAEFGTASLAGFGVGLCVAGFCLGFLVARLTTPKGNVNAEVDTQEEEENVELGDSKETEDDLKEEKQSEMTKEKEVTNIDQE